jgi:hypothetical protein
MRELPQRDDDKCLKNLTSGVLACICRHPIDVHRRKKRVALPAFDHSVGSPRIEEE